MALMSQGWRWNLSIVTFPANCLAVSDTSWKALFCAHWRRCHASLSLSQIQTPLIQTVSSYWRPQNYPHVVSLQRILKPHSIHTSEMNPQLVNKLFYPSSCFYDFAWKPPLPAWKHTLCMMTHIYSPGFPSFPLFSCTTWQHKFKCVTD